MEHNHSKQLGWMMSVYRNPGIGYIWSPGPPARNRGMRHVGELADESVLFFYSLSLFLKLVIRRRRR